MGVITKTSGRSKEYSLLQLNLYGSLGPDGKAYPAGCMHGCAYCYVPGTVKVPRRIFHGEIVPRPKIIERLQADAPKFAGTDKRVLLSFTSDPYQPIPAELDITRQALDILRENNIPFQILTKGGMRAVRDFDLYGPNDAFATTLTRLGVTDSIKEEPKAAMPNDRIATIMLAKKAGLKTWVSIEPVINPLESLALIKETHEYVDLYKIGKLNHRASDIDWRAFGIQAIELCEKFDVPYYIKADLARYLDDVEFHNTDTRIVKESNQ